MSTLKGFFKDTVLYGIASVLPRLINFALLAVYTSAFNTTQFSLQTTWYVYAAFINVVLTLGLETAFFRFYTSESNKNNVISSTFILLTISSVTFLILGIGTSNALTNFFGFANPLFLKILICTTFLDTLVVIPFALLRVTGRPIRFLILKLVNVIFLALITILLLVYIPKLISQDSQIPELLGLTKNFKPDIVHIFMANLAASLLTLVCLFPEILKINWVWDRILILKLLNYSLPIMVGGFAFVINENADKLLIPSLIDKNANGIYSACYKLGVFITLYITAFRLGAEPFFFNHAYTIDAKVKYSKIMTWFVIFGCFFILGVVAFIDLFASMFLRQNIYLSGLIIVPVILLANLFSGIYNNLSIWYKLTDRTRYGMYISIFGAIITIISLLLLVPLLGIMGAALATLITYVTMVLISGFLGRAHYPIPYEIGKLALIILFTILLSGISFLLVRGQFTFNVLLLVFYLLVLTILQKKDITKMMQ